MLICLHVGAHKTASTYMQSRLRQERAALMKREVDQIPHDDVRDEIADRLDAAEKFGGVGYGVARRLIARGLAKRFAGRAGRERVILSDENIAGGITSAVDPRGLYPEVSRRLATTLEALPKGADVRVFFAVRSYAEFFSSIYAYRLGQRIDDDAAEFRARALGLKRGWREVVADICAAAGPERVVVWNHEEFSRAPERIGHALTGDWKPRVFVAGDRASLPSLSRKGLAVLDRAAPLLNQAEHAGLARILARMSFDPPDEKYSLFDAAEAQALGRRYEADLSAIAGLGCRMIGAETDAAAS